MMIAKLAELGLGLVDLVAIATIIGTTGTLVYHVLVMTLDLFR